MLTREQILGHKPKLTVVHVPEWDDGDVKAEVMIRALTVGGAEVLARERNLVDIVIASVVNPDGTPMFSPEDKSELNSKGLAAITRIVEAVNAFNGWSSEAQDALVKNSEPGPNGVSSSA
jgi:hypothetical protein